MPLGRIALAAALAGACLFQAAARADGAFPDEMSVLFPANAPHRIVVGTNFGLVVSDDDGATFRYACEAYISNHALDNVSLYQPGPDGALLAIYASNLSRSSDGACTWTPATGLPSARDAFIDPGDATFSLAVATARGGGDEIHPSHDGGLSFGPAVYTTPDQIFGVEIARSARGVAYATEYARPADGGPASATFLRTADFGAHWSKTPLPTSGPTPVLLLAVDPDNAQVVYLRVASPGGDTLLVTSDGGQTFSAPLTLPTAFAGFALGDDKTIYVGTAAGQLWTKSPLAQTFTERDGPLFRCLAAHAGRLYACGDTLRDGFNLGVSDDGGKTFKPLLKFSNLLGPLTCGPVQSACANDWTYLQRVLAVVPQPGSGGGCHCGSTGAAGTFPLLFAALALSRRRKQKAYEDKG